jgi:predicted nucleic acid-binding Zn ribbon protein
MENDKNARVCPVCGTKIIGRMDKKFCSDQCRYLHNNQSRNQSERLVLETNRQLRRNRSILKKLCPIGKSVVRKEVLDALDYRTDLFTSLFMNDNREVYYLCYDYAMMPLIDKKNVSRALIVTKQSFMKPWNPWRYAKKSGPNPTTPEKDSEG